MLRSVEERYTNHRDDNESHRNVCDRVRSAFHGKRGEALGCSDRYLPEFRIRVDQEDSDNVEDRVHQGDREGFGGIGGECGEQCGDGRSDVGM